MDAAARHTNVFHIRGFSGLLGKSFCLCISIFHLAQYIVSMKPLTAVLRWEFWNSHYGNIRVWFGVSNMAASWDRVSTVGTESVKSEVQSQQDAGLLMC